MGIAGEVAVDCEGVALPGNFAVERGEQLSGANSVAGGQVDLLVHGVAPVIS
ncbi:hypothetical protein D3C79_1015380 [compost metagenome]